MSTGQDSDTSESESCCCSVIVMSWLRKVKELVQDPDKSESAQSHADRPEAGKDKELGMIAATSKEKPLATIGGGTPPKSRSSSSSSSNGYVIIKNPEEGRNVKSEHGSVSPSDYSSVASEATTAASSTPGKKLQCKTLSNMPVAMNNGTGIMHNEELVIGGGYTGHSADDALLHTYDSNFDIWSSLPPAPLKWSSLASLNTKVMLVGGKELGKLRADYTNKICFLDEESKTWRFFHPPMQVGRLSPVVHTYSGYLIVAGGRKSFLDYNVEIFDPIGRCWMTTTPLPQKCFKHTSTTIERTWYLLNEESGQIYYTDILSLVKQSCDYNQHLTNGVQNPLSDKQHSPPTSEPINNEFKASDEKIRISMTWTPIETQPPFKPFRITSIDGYLLAMSTSKGAVTAHIYVDESWKRVGKLPITATTASMTTDSSGKLYLFGGEGSGGQYSFKLMNVSLVSRDAAKPTLHVGLDTAPSIIN